MTAVSASLTRFHRIKTTATGEAGSKGQGPRQPLRIDVLAKYYISDSFCGVQQIRY